MINFAIILKKFRVINVQIIADLDALCLLVESYSLFYFIQGIVFFFFLPVCGNVLRIFIIETGKLFLINSEFKKKFYFPISSILSIFLEIMV